VTDAGGASLWVRAEHLRPEVPAGTEPLSNNHSTDIAPHGSSPIAP
jgi:hypothetical protein